MLEAQILVARQDDVVGVRVLGRATFKVSRELRTFGMQILEEQISGIIVDLSECQGMDSTFIGVLAMIGLQGRGKTDVVVVNASAAHRELLDGIGVSRLCKFAREPVQDVTWRNLCEAAAGAVDMSGAASTVLAAHRTLMDLDPANIPKFKDVVELLSAEVQDHETEGERR